MTLWKGSTDSSPPPSVSPCDSTVVWMPRLAAFSIHQTRSTQRWPYSLSDSTSRARTSSTKSARSPPKLKTRGTSELSHHEVAHQAGVGADVIEHLLQSHPSRPAL
jgi:hypothetical protein